MSIGHSDVTHYIRPEGAKPTDNVEEFILQCVAAGTIKRIVCAKPYQERRLILGTASSTGGGDPYNRVSAAADGPRNPVWKEGQFISNPEGYGM
ncbi:MAG: hypothetical protein L0Y56_15990 [Nitrospira sp.]|nr:hypothetical protein [Nitrospira sp.]